MLAFVRPSGFSGLSETAYPIVVAGVVVVLGGPPPLLRAAAAAWDRRTAAERQTADDVLVNPPAQPAPAPARTLHDPEETT